MFEIELVHERLNPLGELLEGREVGSGGSSSEFLQVGQQDEHGLLGGTAVLQRHVQVKLDVKLLFRFNAAECGSGIYEWK